MRAWPFLLLTACVATGPTVVRRTVETPIEAETSRQIVDGILFIDVETCHPEDTEAFSVETCVTELRAFVRDGSTWRYVDTIPTGLRQHRERSGNEACRYDSELHHRIPVDIRGGHCVEISEPTTRTTSSLSCPEHRGCAVGRRLPPGLAPDSMPTSAEVWDGDRIPDLRGAWSLEEEGWRRTPSCE